MAKLVVIYKQPADAKAFDDHYFGTHVPLVRKVPGLVRCEVTDGAIKSPTGASPYHLMATLEFASMDDLQKGLGSPEGRATAKDLAHFAQAGVEMMIVETKTV